MHMGICFFAYVPTSQIYSTNSTTVLYKPIFRKALEGQCAGNMYVCVIFAHGLACYCSSLVSEIVISLVLRAESLNKAHINTVIIN